MQVPGAASTELLQLRLLIDTNVLIALEPFSGITEPTLAPAARLLQLVARQGHQLYIHRATVDDIGQDRDLLRRRQRIAVTEKYPMLEDAPMSGAFLESAGRSSPGTNDYNDLRLLAALSSLAVTHLISEDARLRKRAARAGLADAVLTIDEAVVLLQQFEPAQLHPPPRVREMEAYRLDTSQPIFDGLRAEYGGFDDWLDKVRRDWRNRICLVIADETNYAGLALLKPEMPCDYSFLAPVMKLTTMKVGDGYAGSKYGELLLKAIFGVANDRRMRSLYVEVYAHHQLLIQILTDFGFRETHHRTRRGELVLLKELAPAEPAPHLNNLQYHVRYGPPALRPTEHCYLVPIEPRFSRRSIGSVHATRDRRSNPALG